MIFDKFLKNIFRMSIYRHVVNNGLNIAIQNLTQNPPRRVIGIDKTDIYTQNIYIL